MGFPVYPQYRSSLCVPRAGDLRGSARDLFGAPKDRRQDLGGASALIDWLSVTSPIGRAIIPCDPLSDVYRAVRLSPRSSSAGSRVPPRLAAGQPSSRPLLEGLDHRRKPVYAGPGRSVALRLPGFLIHGRALGSQFDRLARLVDAKPGTRSFRRLNWLACRSGSAPRSLGQLLHRQGALHRIQPLHWLEVWPISKSVAAQTFTCTRCFGP